MKIENKDEYKDISVKSLELHERTGNALLRGGISNLYQLVEYQDKLDEIKRIGSSGKEEIKSIFEGLTGEKYNTEETLATIPNDFPTNILQMPIDNLKIALRIKNILKKNNIVTIEQVFALKIHEFLRMGSVGPASVNELKTHISMILDKKESYFNENIYLGSNVNNYIENRELDIDTYINLHDNFGLKSEMVRKWYGISKQAFAQKIHRKNNKGLWCRKRLLSEEAEMIRRMIIEKSFYVQSQGVNYYLLNNMDDNVAILIVSEKDIKCFYLRDLPDEIQNIVLENNIQKFTKEELDSIPTLGEFVSILHKPYFKPNKSELFRKLAQNRTMSFDQYSIFLYGVPYCRRNTEITDEKIISFLEEYTTNGITFIPLTPDTAWLRRFISDHNYSIDDFITLYGFNNNIDSESNKDTDAEDIDMQVYQNYDSENFVEKIFSQNPLLGNALLSPSELDFVYQSSRDYLNNLLSASKKKTNLNDDMILSLAIINYAKEWDSVGESGFWAYITKKFGYHGSQHKVGNILRGCLQNALVKNKRWFFTKNDINGYKSTILIHAFSTKSSWLHFCDFLFDFYNENLKCTYYENDPMFSYMIKALCNRIQDVDDDSDENVEINSKYYHFREGIVKLILNKPKYAEQVAARIVKRIDDCINFVSQPAETYEEILCDEWLSGKIQSLSYEKQKKMSENRRSVAIDYAKIKPIYRLYNENRIQIDFPDIRLIENEFERIQLFICNEGKVIKQKSLKYYGNELGKSISEFSVDLDEFLSTSGACKINPQIIIKCDENEIYNSEKSLFRDVIVFQKSKEISLSTCRASGYSFFHTPNTIINFSNAEISPIIRNANLHGDYVELNRDFAVTVNDQLVCFDVPEDPELPHVIISGEKKAVYRENGNVYKVISEKGKIQIITVSTESNKKISLLINNKLFDISCFPCEKYEEKNIYEITVDTIGSEKFTFKIVDLSRDFVYYQESFIYISKFDYRFNRPYYFSGSNFKDAKINVKIHSNEKSYILMKDDTKIDVPYLNGEIEIPVPIIIITDNTNTEWNGNNRYWIKDIPQTTYLRAVIPEGIKISVYFNDMKVSSDGKETFAIGNTIHGYTPLETDNLLTVFADISVGENTSETIILGKIAVIEQFIKRPKLYEKEGKLCWDRGQKFIGDFNNPFQITICENTEYQKEYFITLDSEVIDDSFSLPIGTYSYKISKRSGSIFSNQIKEIISGVFLIGDENELRFLNKTIQLDFITCDNDEYDIKMLKNCYIDNIKYKGIQYIAAEESECPIYEGIMFFKDNSERRHEYSYFDTKDKNGIKHEKINPVKMIYINDTTLSLVSESNDGFNVYRSRDRYTRDYIYQITDRVQTIADMEDYDSADLYIFSIKGE